MKLNNTLHWKEGGGCHWCGRNTESMTDGHDGMCPVPLLVLFENRVAQLEAENERFARAIYWASNRFLRIGEKSSSAIMGDALRDKEEVNVASNDSPEEYRLRKN